MVRTDGRAYVYVIAKFSKFFLPMVLRCARFARESSAMLKKKRKKSKVSSGAHASTSLHVQARHQSLVRNRLDLTFRRYSGHASHFLFHAHYDYASAKKWCIMRMCISWLCTFLYEHKPLRAMTCIKISGSEKRYWFSRYLWCAHFEPLKAKSREFPKLCDEELHSVIP